VRTEAPHLPGRGHTGQPAVVVAVGADAGGLDPRAIAEGLHQLADGHRPQADAERAFAVVAPAMQVARLPVEAPERAAMQPPERDGVDGGEPLDRGRYVVTLLSLRLPRQRRRSTAAR
jgi:hypothetical protein